MSTIVKNRDVEIKKKEKKKDISNYYSLTFFKFVCR